MLPPTETLEGAGHRTAGDHYQMVLPGPGGVQFTGCCTDNCIIGQNTWWREIFMCIHRFFELLCMLGGYDRLYPGALND